MDMSCVDEVLTCADPERWQPGDSWLAGGTVLFSYGTDITQGPPRRLLDITEAGWTPTQWRCDASGEPLELEIAATCLIKDIFEFRANGPRLPAHTDRVLPGLDLFAPCCDSFVASWKIWNASTIGGNVATGLPAGPMISLLSGLDAVALLWGPRGSLRAVPVADLVVGEAQTTLEPGELIRSFHVPIAALTQPCAFRRISLTERGRTAALIIGRRLGADTLRLAITGSTRRPHIIDLGPDAAHAATCAGLQAAIDEAVAGVWHDDIHGTPQWREAMTHRLGAEILTELLDPAEPHPRFAARTTGDITMTRSTR
ncbi:MULTISPECIES: FAD binding domain-containing protein [unclassified Brevibacterium]|uniref:FAD binding domain-containing protein n=1 Tax=unclassified Brevibacterium TaxID=2614124 RepID=UPI0010F5BBA9|nr:MULTISPECIES: FAD binding domain-containing protein [unclassified Brevibacterium]MCM1013318.1 FAD binding domain-containing protein [Brevibacterium sp. XM4083]